MIIVIYDTFVISAMNLFFSPTKILDSLILMQIVREGPLHGYALTALIEENFCWKPSQTAVYNSLKSMENENMVSSEEKIEKGRVQKIYSITEKGQQFFEETQQKMKKRMMKNFSQFISFAQKVGEIENSEESEALQQNIHSIIKDMSKISRMSFLLLREAPEETQAVIENTLTSLKKIVKKYDIQYEEEENEED